MGGLDRVLAKRLAQNDANVVAFGEENRQLRYARIDNRADDVLGQFIIGLDDHFAGIGIDDVADSKRAFKIFRIDLETLDLGLFDVVVHRSRDLLARVNKDFLRLRMRDVLRHLQSNDVVGNIPENFLAFDRQTIGLIESADAFLISL